jgi:alpha-tubulin suppressor-like RCC1 family protein
MKNVFEINKNDNLLSSKTTSKFNLAVGDKIIAMSLGYYSSSAVSLNGRVFTWSWNDLDQLGDVITTARSLPTEITSKFNLAVGDKIIAMSLGFEHTSAVSLNGRVFTWGENDVGQLGDNTTTNKSVPTEITSKFNLAVGDKIIAMSLGSRHSSAVSLNGRVFTWGRNRVGQLGDNTTTNKSAPTEITSKFNLAVGDNIIAMSLGFEHTSAVSLNGRVFTWGENDLGQLGDGTITQRNTPTEITSKFNLAVGDKIIAMSLGFRHTSAISLNGRVFTWGENNNGQLGDNTTTNKSAPTEITSKFNLAVGDKIIAMSLEFEHSSAVSSTGRIFKWGFYRSATKAGEYNYFLGDYLEKTYPIYDSIPIDIKPYFSLDSGDKIVASFQSLSKLLVLSYKGRVFYWSADFQEYKKGKTTEITSKFNLAVGDKIIAMSLGYYSSSAVSLNGRVFTWGKNYYGQLGEGASDKILPTELTVLFSSNAK